VGRAFEDLLPGCLPAWHQPSLLGLHPALAPHFAHRSPARLEPFFDYSPFHQPTYSPFNQPGFYAPLRPHHQRARAASLLTDVLQTLERASLMAAQQTLERASLPTDEDAVCWHEGDDDKYHSSFQLPGFALSELRAELSDGNQRITVRGSSTSPERKVETSRTLQLPYAVQDPSVIELHHLDGRVSVSVPKTAEADAPEPIKLPITAAPEPDKTMTEADKPIVAEADKAASEEAQLDQKFAAVVARSETDKLEAESSAGDEAPIPPKPEPSNGPLES